MKEFKKDDIVQIIEDNVNEGICPEEGTPVLYLSKEELTNIIIEGFLKMGYKEAL